MFRFGLMCVLVGVVAAEGILGSTVAGTLVRAERGNRRIETVQIGDKVWGFNPRTRLTELRDVTNTTSRMVSTLLTVRLQGGVVFTVTPEHPVFVLRKGWVDAGELLRGDVVRQMIGRGARVQSVAPRVLGEAREVFNLDVEELRNYYITRARLLVRSVPSTFRSEGLLVNSFVAGTLVWTEGGKKRIDAIRRGDKVLGFNVRQGVVGVHAVTGVSRRVVRLVLMVVFQDGAKVLATPGHPLYVASKGWVQVRNLQPGDAINDVTGHGVPVTAVVPVSGVRVVFNLNVEGAENYFVSSAGLLARSVGVSSR